MFLAKPKQENGIPFELKIPNKTTQKAMDDVRNSKNTESTTIEQIKQELESIKNAKH